MGIFNIEASNLHWINDKDSSKDICLHGDVTLYIGKNELQYENAPIAIDEYKAEVFKFADEIEKFYQSSTQKSLPKGKKGEFERNGYTVFWNEWHLRRQA